MGLSQLLAQTPLFEQASEKDWKKSASKLGCHPAALKALAMAESKKLQGFEMGKPLLEFRTGLFKNRTDHKFSKRIELTDVLPNAPQDLHYRMLSNAYVLAPKEAIESGRWGLFKVPGFKALETMGLEHDDFLQKMFRHEPFHFAALIAVVDSLGAGKYLGSKEWTEFAKRYNPSGYMQDKYDVKIRQAYQKFAK